MDTTLIVAMLTAAAIVIAAWIGISRQPKKKTDMKWEIYLSLQKQIYEVRCHSAKIRHLLSHDPGPNFAQDIVSAGKAFREACDSLQNVVGGNRLLISKNTYDGVADLIHASAELINSLNLAMGGVFTPAQTVRELTDRGKVFQERLAEVETLISKEVNKL